MSLVGPLISARRLLREGAYKERADGLKQRTLERVVMAPRVNDQNLEKQTLGGNVMGVFTRVRDIINSNINSMLDHAENPEKLVKLMIHEMEDTLVEIKASLRRGHGVQEKGAPRAGRGSG